VFTVQEGLDAIPDVIYHLETYDVTTVRASTPMYLLSRKIKAMGVKMVLSGEGSDEIFGGNVCSNLMLVLGEILTNVQGTSTFTKPRMQRPSTKSAYVASRIYIPQIVCVQTSTLRPSPILLYMLNCKLVYPQVNNGMGS
jgi:asparagine synthetase B (glutamine-hydrolysing)